VSSKKRPPSRGSGEVSTGDKVALVEPDRSVQMGNQAEWATLSQQGSDSALPDWSLIMDAAQPLLQHSMMSIQMDAQSTTQNDRLRSIVEQSTFAEGHKQLLLTDMKMKESQARTVSQGLQDIFGDDSPELRAELWDCMFRCLEGMRQGTGVTDNATWQLKDGAEISLGDVPASHSLTQNTDIAVERFAGHFSKGLLQERFEGTEQTGVAIRKFCRNLYLAIQLDEEEEEEETWASPDLE